MDDAKRKSPVVLAIICTIVFALVAGVIAFFPMVTCANCKGAGKVEWEQVKIMADSKLSVEKRTDECPCCNSTGKVSTIQKIFQVRSMSPP